MRASRFVTGIRDTVDVWDHKLRLMYETLEEWFVLQVPFCRFAAVNSCNRCPPLPLLPLPANPSLSPVTDTVPANLHCSRYRPWQRYRYRHHTL